MKKKYFKIPIICLLAGMLSILCACKEKTEIAITDDGIDITVATKQYETLKESKEDKFTYNDLVVDKLKYLMSEKEVVNLLGEPTVNYNNNQANENDAQNKINEKIYVYDELTLIFSEIKGQYVLTGAASAGNNIFARGIKVGDTFDDILEKYYRDVNCMNENYYTEDKSNIIGKRLYGKICLEDLERVKTSDKVEYGIINLNGSSSIEMADTYMVEFTYFDKTYKNGYATIDDDFAQLTFDIDKNGFITAIRWYYYTEQ